VTETVCESLAVPPAPVQVSVNVFAAAVRATLVVDPDIAWLPLHAPLATHDVAFDDVQDKTLVAPLGTSVGNAEREMVGIGGAVTETETVRESEPPAPVQVSVKFESDASACVVSIPLSALVPLQLPDAEHDVASLDAHINVAEPPVRTAVGETDRVTDGRRIGTVTVTTAEACAVSPAAPMQVNVNVLFVVRAPLSMEPLTLFAPNHAPEAEHSLALVEDQVMVAESPEKTEVGFAVTVTVGAGGDATGTSTEA
jgi:hypothetical protein